MDLYVRKCCYFLRKKVPGDCFSAVEEILCMENERRVLCCEGDIGKRRKHVGDASTCIGSSVFCLHKPFGVDICVRNKCVRRHLLVRFLTMYGSCGYGIGINSHGYFSAMYSVAMPKVSGMDRADWKPVSFRSDSNALPYGNV